MSPRRFVSFVLASALAAPALAQTLPVPHNVVNLSASASVEVAKDLLSIAFSTSREGADAAAVQSQLKQALDAALVEARKAARPGQLEVRTGNFSLYPRYAPKNGGLSAWQGSAELVVEGRDTQAIAELSGRIQTLSIARVAFALSREARAKVEDEAGAQAIAGFRAKADSVAGQFGFASWTLREVQIASSEPPSIGLPMLRAQVSRAQADEALPVEAGKAVVTAVVSGSVQLHK